MHAVCFFISVAICDKQQMSKLKQNMAPGGEAPDAPFFLP
nr:MAG TPA: hypothetical protein [Herelleviridae sp.]DAV56474.1 MAG TPA: hypothetical protein [Bacteriophage sp.]DAW36810.1 MAG TPA: hypothetical protein [Caudoviricetes sp.]